MASSDFEIDSYTVSVGQLETESIRGLTLTSIAQSHGIRDRARISFSSGGSGFGLGLVSNVDQPNFECLTVLAFLGINNFAEWYDVLRNERPVRCSFLYDGDFDPTRPRRALQLIGISTGTQEPLGEGPEGFLRRFPESALHEFKK